eukprot:2276492-Pyramimonas_sp.AAC.1
MPWMARSRARAGHHRPAPLPSLKMVRKPNQQLERPPEKAPRAHPEGGPERTFRALGPERFPG